VDQVCQWLRANDLDCYQASFRSNDVHGRELLALSRYDLKACNMFLCSLTRSHCVNKLLSYRRETARCMVSQFRPKVEEDIGL